MLEAKKKYLLSKVQRGERETHTKMVDFSVYFLSSFQTNVHSLAINTVSTLNLNNL